MVKLATALLLAIMLLSSAYAHADIISADASGSITAASISAVASASSASQAVSYKYYDKPWLMDPPPKELTLNEYEIFQFAQYMNDHYLPMVASSPYQAKLQTMVDEIASATPRPYVKYTVKIVDNPEVNAFVLPTGSIYVYNGLLKKIESDDELAGVLAHEIAHNVRFHIIQRLSENAPALGSQTLGKAVLIGGFATLNPALVSIGMLADGTITAIMSEISVHKEDEADTLGYEYIKKTRYSPVGLMIFMERLAALHGEDEKGYGIYMNHSLSVDRVAMLKRYMKQDGFNIVAEKRKVLKIPNIEVSEIKQGSGTAAAYKVVYNKMDIITFAHTDANKIKATKLAENINQILNNSGEIYQLKIKNTGKTRELYYRDALLYILSNNDLTDNTAANIDILAQDVLQKLKQVIRNDAISAHRTDI